MSDRAPRRQNTRLSIFSRLRAAGGLFAALGGPGGFAAALRSPTWEADVDGRGISNYAAFQRERQAEASVASRLDPHQTKVPQFPKVTGRRLQELGYRRNEVVRRAFDLIIEATTQAIPELLGPDGRPATGPRVADFDHLMRFPAGPDEDLTGIDMWVRFWLDVLGTGNGILEMVPGLGTDFPVRLWRMDPARTAIEPGEDRRIHRYVYELGGQLFEIPTERVLHFRLWDPLSEFWGIPRLFSALRSLATDSDLIDMMKVTFQNLGVPPVVLEYPLDSIVKGMEAGALTLVPPQDMLEEVASKWAQKYTGVKRGSTGVAWGFNVKLIGLDFQKLAIGDNVATTERRILMVHGINPLLVGQSGTGQQKGHNFRDTREFFYSQAIKGLLRQSGEVFSSRLAPRFGEGFTFRFQTRQIDALRDARLRRGKEAAEIFRVGLLKRHACQELMGELPDGDDIFYPDVYSSTTAAVTSSADSGEQEDE